MFKNGARLEKSGMSLDVPNLKSQSLDKHHDRLRAEANENIDEIPVQETKKKTQIIAK